MSAQAVAVLQACRSRGWMLATAESCTGGKIAAALTDIAGSSDVLGFGFVTYSNAAKLKVLGIPPHILSNYGAVSIQTAEAMAIGALNCSHANIAISVTGIAGPGGAVSGKPVGTVCFGLARSDAKTQSVRRQFSGDRNRVREEAVDFALQLILRAANQIE